MDISVIGAGNGGCAFAAYLASINIKSTIYANSAHATNIHAIETNGGLLVDGKINNFYSTIQTTNNLEEALSKAEVILLALPSYALDNIFNEMTDYIQDHQVILFLPGNFSSVVFSNKMKKKKINKKVSLIECNTFPIGCRVNKPGNVTIYAFKDRVSLGIHKNTLSFEAKAAIEKIFPTKINWLENTLAIGLQCLNGVVHPGTAVLNAGWVETTGGDFYFYKQGMSDSVCKVLTKIDQDRMHIASLLDLKLPSFCDVIKDFYDIDAKSIREFTANTLIHNAIKASPESLSHRYLNEDVPYTLVPWYEIGRLCSYNSEVMYCIIKLASFLNNKNYLQEGINAKKMGISNINDLKESFYG